MKPIRWLTVALGVLVSAVIVGFIVRDVDAARLTRALAAVDWSWIVLGVIAILATMIARVRRWAVLLHPIVLPPSTLLRALLIGQVLNFVLPIRLGDVARSAVLGRAAGSSFERVLGSVAIEKAWDWLTLALLAIGVALSMPAWESVPLRSIGLIAAIVLIGFGVIALAPTGRWQPRLERFINAASARLSLSRLKFADRVRRLLDSLVALRDRQAVGQAAAWSLLTWGLGVAANYGVMRAYAVESWSGALGLMVALMIGITLPPSIAALGLFEGVTIAALSVVAVPLETALAIGLTLHVVTFAPPLIVAGLLLISDQSGSRSS
jgi:glycosyltransferase 2 family protein